MKQRVGQAQRLVWHKTRGSESDPFSPSSFPSPSPSPAVGRCVVYVLCVLCNLLLDGAGISDIRLPTGPKREEDPVEATRSLYEAAVARMGLHVGTIARAAGCVLAAWTLRRRQCCISHGSPPALDKAA